MNTISGVRGAIAIEHIDTYENILEIPYHIMMSPPLIFKDPDVGSILYKYQDALCSDLLLTVYLMHEISKGEQSFYYPFLRILPKPSNISEWHDDELLLLQVNEDNANSDDYNDNSDNYHASIDDDATNVILMLRLMPC